MARKHGALTPMQRKRRAAHRRSAYRKRKLAQGFLWEHTGGGTWLVSVKGAVTHPCDDTYENLKTGEIATLRTTFGAHFNTLRSHRWLKRISEVTKLPGVKLESRKTRARIEREYRAWTKAVRP